MKIVLFVIIGDPCPISTTSLIIIPEDQTSLHLPADAFQRGSSQHSFRGAARSDIEVDACARISCVDDSGDIAIRNQMHSRTNKVVHEPRRGCNGQRAQAQRLIRKL